MNALDRRARPGDRPGRAIFLVWAGLCGLLLAMAGDDIAQGRLPGSDSMLRLAQVRDLIAGQGWYDLHQYRIAPGQGVSLNLSRLVDAPLWLSIALLTPLVGQAAAEQATMIAVPLLILGLVLAVVGRIAWRLHGVEAAVFTCLAVGLAPAIVEQVQPLSIDHRAYQILAAALALWAISWRSPMKGGAVAGLAMAAGCMISLEMLPLTAAFGGVLALRWLRDPQLRGWLVAYMQVMALGMVAVFALTRGVADLAVHCDVISPPQIGFFLVAALGVGAIAALPQLTRPMLVALLCLAGVLALGFVALTGGQCLAPPLGLLDQMLRGHWYQAASGWAPLWRQDAALAIPALVQGVIALIVGVVLMIRSKDWLRHWWLEYSLLLAAALIAGVLNFGSMAFAAVIGAIALGWLADRIARAARHAEGWGGRLVGVLALVGVVMPAVPIIAVGNLTRQSTGGGPESLRESGCGLRGDAHLLDRLAPSVLFSPPGIAPTILHSSRHVVVAVRHHRAQRAMRDVTKAFTGNSEAARPIVARYRADYVVICSGLRESADFVAIGGKASLAARLIDDDPPSWLEPVDLGGPPQLKVWKVRHRRDAPNAVP